jgi:poly-gamma-glutamate synthesis protein (capsule biosynthesis protein)
MWKPVTGAGLIRFQVAIVLATSLAAGCTPMRPSTLTPAQFPTPAPAAPDRPPATPAPRSFTVVASGDVLLHTPLWDQARQDAAAAGEPGYDFGPMFASVQPVVSSADLAICHMETPLGDPDGPFSSYPTFNVPPQVATTLADIGYDTCTTASNHSIDKGAAGVQRTLDALDAAGIKHAGTARDEVEWATPTLLRVGDVTVASLSYTFSFNGLRRPRDKPWLANPIDVDTILFDARRARIAGADVVIVSLHFGTEYSSSPNRYQLDIGRDLIGSPDIDLIIGHHAHVVQPMEKVGGKWIAYGMGNEVSNQTREGTRDGIMPRFTFSEVSRGVFQVTRVEVFALHMWTSGAKRVYDIAAVLADPATPDYLRAAALGTLRRVRSVLSKRGAFDDGLILAGAQYL